MDVVTGAFGFSGSHIARELLARGHQVRTLTAHPNRPNEFGNAVEVYPLNFDNTEQLIENMLGADVLYNTYWIRFAHGSTTFEKAVANSQELIDAAKAAGVRRIVHVSITNPSEASALPYFSGKARVENAIRESGLSYAILRPAVLFGDKGILINNIAWFLRHLPVFAVPGSGRYKLQPVLAEDLARLAVEWGSNNENTVLDAVGPEVFEFNDLVRLIREVVRSRALIAHIPAALASPACAMLGMLVSDVVLTRDEVVGLHQNLLISAKPPTCSTKLSDWLRANADALGRRYFSELAAHYK